MPAGFDRCVKQGGKVITKTVDKNRYIHICYLKGQSYPGEVKTKKEKK